MVLTGAPTSPCGPWLPVIPGTPGAPGMPYVEKRKKILVMTTSMRPAERNSYDTGKVHKAIFPHLKFRGHLELHY